MKKYSRMNKILIYFFIIFISCTISSSLIYHYASNALIHYAETTITEIAKQGSEIVVRDIDKNFSILETLAKVDRIQNPEIPIEEKLDMLNIYFKSDEFIRISISDLSGYAKTTDGTDLYIGDRDYYLKAIEGRNNVSDPVISRVDGSYVVAFAVPVYHGNKIVYILYATYPVEALSVMTDKIKLGNEGYSFIINKKGTIIAHENRELVYKQANYLENAEHYPSLIPLKKLQQQMIEGKLGAGKYQYNGINKYMGFAPIQGTEWSLGVCAPYKMILGDINKFIFFIIISSIAVVFSIVILNLYLYLLKSKLNKQVMLSQNAIETAKIIILRFDNDGKMIGFNQYAEEKTGYKSDEIIHKKNIYDLIQEDSISKVKEFMINFNKQTHDTNFEFALKGKNGGYIHIVWNINLSDQARIKENIEIMGIDITDRVRIEKELQDQHEELLSLYEELAASEEELKTQFDQLTYHQEQLTKSEYFDSLTGLPNRFNLITQFKSMIKESSTVVLLFIDLDNFKLVNDSYGHNFGDLLLKEVGKRLNGIKGYQYLVSKLGGDEYAVLLPNLLNKEDIIEYCNLLIDRLNQGYEIESIHLSVSVSIGIAIYPENGKIFEELFKNADIAMYRAKESGKNRYIFFTKKMDDKIVEKMTIQNNMSNALQNNEFILHYQPQFDAKDRYITGFEALVRWNSLALGTVSPMKFIEIAEENRIIIPLGEWILRTACKFIKRINEEHSSQYSISVNISIIQLLQDNFVDMVIRTLHDNGLNPALLELELTESILMQSFEIVIEKLNKLKKSGVRIALDDFGKGYSSLSYLKHLPISTLKIDKSFIDNIEDAGTLTESIIYMGKKMDLLVIAEGVESQRQLEYLTKNKCDRIQGYLLGKPMSEKKISEFIDTQNI